MSEHETEHGHTAGTELTDSPAAGEGQGGVERAPQAETVDAHVSVENPFDEQEILQFDADDAKAGRTIGKMLALFFLYTVIVMTFVGIWTWRVTS